MSTPSGLHDLLATMTDQATKLGTVAIDVYDRAEPVQLQDFPLYVGGTADRLLETLDGVVEHLAKLGVVHVRGEASR